MACNHPVGVRLPGHPPILPGSPTWSWRRSEKPAMSVRFALRAPTVTVAEWLRRATVDRSTRVQFSPVTPFSIWAHRPKGQDRTLRTFRLGFDSSCVYHLFDRPCGPVGESGRPRFPVTEQIASSNLVGSAKVFGSVTQLAEYLAFKQDDVGSLPTGPTRFIDRYHNW